MSIITDISVWKRLIMTHTDLLDSSKFSDYGLYDRRKLPNLAEYKLIL